MIISHLFKSKEMKGGGDSEKIISSTFSVLLPQFDFTSIDQSIRCWSSNSSGKILERTGVSLYLKLTFALLNQSTQVCMCLIHMSMNSMITQTHVPNKINLVPLHVVHICWMDRPQCNLTLFLLFQFWKMILVWLLTD